MSEGRPGNASGRASVSPIRRVRYGELIALAGAISVIVALTLSWYGGARTASGHLSAWSTFGPTIVLLMIGCAIALLLVLTNLFERGTPAPVASAVWTTCFGFIAVICAVVRLLERPDGATSLQAGAWVGFAGALAILVGGWESMRDERPSLYDPVSAELKPPPA